MKTFAIPVSESWKPFIEDAVSRDGHKSPTDFVESLLRDARTRKAEEMLDRLVREAEESGESTPWTKEDWRQIRQEVAKRLAQKRSGKAE